MRRMLLLACSFSLLALSSFGQLSQPGTPPSFQTKSLTGSIPTVVMPALNMTSIEQQDLQEDLAGIPPRFGLPYEVNYSLSNSGIWEDYPDGSRVWRLKVTAPDALSINFCYSDWHMPPGAEFYVYSADRRHVIGAFTERNNKQDRVFATGLVYGDAVILEYYEPAEVRGQGSATISRIVHGYRYIADLVEMDGVEESFGSSGPCQVNVNCSPEGNSWQDEKRSVAMILSSGFRLCTGSLINTTRGDCTPYFLTADHCAESFDAITNPNVNTWSFYWMYESPGCTSGTDFLPPSTNGAVMKANDVPSDFVLLLLNESPADIAGVNPYFNGWNATFSPGTGGAGIHHPAGDIKKIATHSMTPASDDWFGTSPATSHWRVLWDATPNGHSVTEGGSSGSPLFDNNGRVLGQLHGGSSINCSNPAIDPGHYGALAYSLNNAGATDVRRKLSPWLDPDATGATIVDGTYGDCSSGCLSPSGLNASAITETTAVLGWTAVSGALGYNVRYRQVGSPTWINGSSAGASISVSSLVSCTQYEFQVATVCDASTTSFYSLSFLFKSGGCPCLDYCTSGGGTVDEFIQSVSIGSLNNVTGNDGGYANFTGTSATASYLQGSSYPVTLTPGYTSTVYGEWFRVYIDYNQDGDFLDAGELAYDAGGTVSGVPATGSILIPASAPSGTTGLRVVMVWSVAPASCGVVTYGETEDYCVTIGAPVTCSTATPPQNPSSSVGASSVALSWTPVAESVACQVKATRTSPPGPTGTRNVIGFEASSTNLPFSILGPGTTWQWQVRCACSTSPIAATAFSSFNNFTVPTFRTGDLSENLTVYPNPADQRITLEYFAGFDGPVQVQMTDLLGRMVLSTTANLTAGANTLELNTSNLSSGHYLVQLLGGEGLGTYPVYIEHSAR